MGTSANSGMHMDTSSSSFKAPCAAQVRSCSMVQWENTHPAKLQAGFELGTAKAH